MPRGELGKSSYQGQWWIQHFIGKYGAKLRVCRNTRHALDTRALRLRRQAFQRIVSVGSMPKAYCIVRLDARGGCKKKKQRRHREERQTQCKWVRILPRRSRCVVHFLKPFFFVGIGRRRIGHWGSLLSNCYQAASYASKTRQS